jgi:hypothetical protein
MKRVLIIEDSPMVLKYLLDVLYPRWSPFSVDFHVTMTTSGGEAKRLVSGVPTNNGRLLELGVHIALDKNSLHFYDQVKQLVA